MTIQETLQSDLKEAMKARNIEKLSTLRMISSALQSRQIEKRAKVGDQSIVLTDEEVMAVLKHEAKKRQDSSEQYRAAGRTELATKEQSELGIIQAYLPKEMDDASLEAIIRHVIGIMGAVTMKDFGKIMAAVMKETKGAVSGDRVSVMVKKILQ